MSHPGLSSGSQSKGSPAQRPKRSHSAGKAFKAIYYGSVVFPETPTREKVDEAIKKAKRTYHTTAEENHKVLIVLGNRTMKVVDHETKSDLQVVAIGMLAYCTQDASQPEILVYATRTADTRVNVIIGHVFTLQNEKVASTVAAAVRQAFAELPPEERAVPNESPYEIIAGATSDTKMFDALYLGYVRVGKSEGTKVIKKAAEINAVARARMQSERQNKGLRRTSVLRGGVSSSQEGIAVEEDPVTIIITPRSLRIIERLAGETVFKFLLPTVTFASSTKGNKVDIFGFIVHNERLKLTNCHLFHMPSGEGSALGKVIGTALSEYKKAFGGLNLKKNPWDVAPDARREAAPAELFQKQVRRRDLQAVAIIGAGEYGEVYLALQTVAMRTPEGNDVTVRVPRAVKMMKSAATDKVKEEYTREAITLLKVGDHDNVVQIIGVCVQQAPWLVVLEFVQFGDLRAVLQAYKENNLELTLREILHLNKQIVAGCAHITRARMVHMDLAARNVLLALNNVVKIGDFGMARQMANDGDYLILRDKVPLALKWSAIESMDSRFFSEASDCWSCGVTMWEILTYGEFPYPGVKMESVQTLVREGLRLPQPPNCPDELWKIIHKCWSFQIRDRWKFDDLHVILEKLEQRYQSSDPQQQDHTPPRDIGVTIAGGEPPQWTKDVTAKKPESPQVSRAKSRNPPSPKGRSSPRSAAVVGEFRSGGTNSPTAMARRKLTSGRSRSQSHQDLSTSSPTKDGKGSLFRSRLKSEGDSTLPKEMRHLNVGSIPNFTAGSGRLKAQGPLRGRNPFET